MNVVSVVGKMKMNDIWIRMYFAVILGTGIAYIITIFNIKRAWIVILTIVLLALIFTTPFVIMLEKTICK